MSNWEHLKFWGLSTSLQFPFCHVVSTVSYWQTLSNIHPSLAIKSFCEADLLLVKEDRLAILFQLPSVSTAEKLPQNKPQSLSLIHHISSVLGLCIGRQKFTGGDLSKTKRGQRACSAFPGQIHWIIRAAQQQQWPYLFFSQNNRESHWLEELSDKSTSSPCTSLAFVASSLASKNLSTGWSQLEEESPSRALPA